MLNLLLKRIGIGLTCVVVASLFFCRPPKGNEKLSSNSPIIKNTLKRPVIASVRSTSVDLDSFRLQGLSFTFRVAELVRTLGQPDSILLPKMACGLKEDEIFRQYYYESITCMTYGDLSKKGAAPRVENGLVEHISFEGNDLQLDYKGQQLDRHTSIESLAALFPKSISEPTGNDKRLLRLRVKVKGEMQAIGFYFKAGRLVEFAHFFPCASVVG